MRLLRVFLLMCLCSSAHAVGYVQAPLFNNISMSTGDLVSIGLDMNQILTSSIQAEWTGSLAAGTLAVQVSDDIVYPSQSGNPGANVVNWSTYGSTQAVSGSGAFFVNLTNNGWRWMRLKYSFISGAGAINANYMGKNQ